MYLKKRHLMNMLAAFFIVLFITTEIFHNLFKGFSMSVYGTLIGGLLANAIEKQIALQRGTTLRFIVGALLFILVTLSLFTFFFS